MAVGLPAGVLVGRDEELVRLHGVLDGLVAGRGRVVWVEGEPGIGKSALLAAGLEQAAVAGCEVFWASAYEAGAQFPLRVVLDALRIGPRSVDRARAEIAGLLWGRGGSVALTAEDMAAVVAEQLVTFIDQLCATTAVVLVCDDLQWADDYSLGVWARLARLVEQLPLLLVAAARPVPRRAQLAQLRRAVSGSDALLLRLGALPAGSVRELVGRLVGADPGPGLTGRAAQAGGNPLWVRELVEALLREDLVSVQAGVADVREDAGGVAGPQSLSAAIADRLGFLSEPATEVLRMAALLGVQFSAAHLAVLLGQSATQLVAVIDEAVAAGVLVEVGGRLGFRHGLIRQALYESTPAALRTVLHRQLAQALAEAGAPIEQVAEQLPPTLDAPDEWVLAWLAEAAPALVQRAPQTAMDLLQRARQALNIGDPRRESLEVNLATGLLLLGLFTEVEQVARPVLAVTGDPAVVGPLTWNLGRALLDMARPEEALAATEAALRDRTLDPMWTARLRALQASTLWAIDRWDEAEATARRAEAEGRQVGDRFAIGYALHNQCLVQAMHLRDYAAALRLADRALAVLGDDVEASDLRLLVLGNRSAALDNLGRPSEADRAFSEALVLADRTGNPHRLAAIRLQAADAYFHYGRWDEALAELDAAADQLRSSPVKWLWLHGIGALIAVHRNDRAALASHGRAVEDIPLTRGDMRYFAQRVWVAQALAAERGGQPETALAQLLAMFDPRSTLEFPELTGESPLWVPDLVRLAVAVGDRGTAEAATRACAAHTRQARWPYAKAAAEHCTGILVGDPACVLAAADIYQQCGYQLFRAQALENAAVLLAGGGDSRAARAAYTDAAGIYTTLGADWDLRRADARLRPLGLRRGVRGPRRRPTTGWDALTPTEHKVATRVATGRANADIATELFLSRRTVEAHVAHILTKLDAHSRVEIARVASRHEPEVK